MKVAKKSELELAAKLQLTLGRVVRLIRQQGGDGLTPSQMSGLSTIAEFGPLRNCDLASREGIAAPVATRVVASLEDLGYVNRIQDPNDGRAYQMKASPLGLSVLKDVRTSRTQGLAARLAELSAEENLQLEAALSVFEKLVAARE